MGENKVIWTISTSFYLVKLTGKIKKTRRTKESKKITKQKIQAPKTKKIQKKK